MNISLVPGTVLNVLHALFHLTLPMTQNYRYDHHTEQRRSLRHRDGERLERDHSASQRWTSQDSRSSYSTACTWDKCVREGTKQTVSSRSQSSYLTRQAAQVTSESTSADMLRDQIEKGPAPKAGFAECLGFRQALKGRAA